MKKSKFIDEQWEAILMVALLLSAPSPSRKFSSDGTDFIIQQFRPYKGHFLPDSIYSAFGRNRDVPQRITALVLYDLHYAGPRQLYGHADTIGTGVRNIRGVNQGVTFPRRHDPTIEDIDLIDVLWRQDAAVEKGLNYLVQAPDRQHEFDLAVLREKAVFERVAEDHRHTIAPIVDSKEGDDILAKSFALALELPYPSYAPVDHRLIDSKGSAGLVVPVDNPELSKDPTDHSAQPQQQWSPQPTKDLTPSLYEHFLDGASNEVDLSSCDPFLSWTIPFDDSLNYDLSNVASSSVQTSFDVDTIETPVLDLTRDDIAALFASQQVLTDVAESSSPSAKSASFGEINSPLLSHTQLDWDGLESDLMDTSDWWGLDVEMPPLDNMMPMVDQNEPSQLGCLPTDIQPGPSGYIVSHDHSYIEGSSSAQRYSVSDSSDISAYVDVCTTPGSEGGRPKSRVSPAAAAARSAASRDAKNDGLLRDADLQWTAVEIGDMSTDEFQTLLKRVDISEAQKEVLRKVRRRSKNKLAARNCRQRRDGHIQQLEDEVTQLFEEQDEIQETSERLAAMLAEERRNVQRLGWDLNLACDVSDANFVEDADGNLFVIKKDDA